MSSDIHETRITINVSNAMSDEIGRVADEYGYGSKAALIRVATTQFLKNLTQSNLPSSHTGKTPHGGN